MKRPGHSTGFTGTTPRAVATISLTGAGLRGEGVYLTNDEYRAVAKLYGYTPEGPNQRPPEPERPSEPERYSNEWQKYRDALKAWQNWEDPRDYMQAGADRNLARYVDRDGFRLMGWLARYVEPDQDPLQLLIQMAARCGWEVDPEDLAWAGGEEQVDKDEV